MSDEICVNCGHSKFDHAISLKGIVGTCMKTFIEGWSYCDCKEFCPTKRAGDLASPVANDVSHPEWIDAKRVRPVNPPHATNTYR